jgi:competence protein ComEC
MYINSLFLLLFWCLGWSAIDFTSGLVVVIGLAGYNLMASRHTQLVWSALAIFIIASLAQYQAANAQFPNWTGQDLHLTGCVLAVQKSSTGMRLQVGKGQLVAPMLLSGAQASEANDRVIKRRLSYSGYIEISVYPYNASAQPQWPKQPKLAVGQLEAEPDMAALIGQRVQLLVRLKAARNYANPHSFDYRRWTQVEGQFASGYVKQWLTTEDSCATWTWSLLQLSKLRQSLWQDLQGLSLSPASTALWGALMLGQTAALSADQWRVLATTGTTHLMVISGLHVGLVALMAMALMRALLLPLALSNNLGVRLCGWFAVVVALSFALLSGFGLPAQRAVIMLIGLLWGQLWGTQLGFMQRLYIAFALTLALQPGSATSLGFWLSYTAVLALGLVWYGTSLQSKWRKLIRLLAAQAALSALLLPVIAMATGYVSFVGPLINLLLVPLFSLVVIPILMLLSLLALLIGLPDLLLALVDTCLAAIWQALALVAEWPWAQVNVARAPIGVWLGLLLTGILSLLIRRWLALLLALFIPLLAFALLPLERSNTNQQVTLKLLDVGQGLSVWLQQGDFNMLYDLGNQYHSGFNLVDAVILPEFHAQGVGQVDRLVVSHWDRDHSGGLNKLFKQLPVKHLVLPSERHSKREQKLSLNVNNTSRCKSTTWHKADNSHTTNLELRYIALAQQGLKGNNASCIVLLRIHGRQILLVGDIEAKAEKMLLAQQPDLLTSDILIAPHHGSKTSSTKDFLAMVRPSFVLISSGANNAFGHPHKQVLQNYLWAGSQWYNTGRHGQITITIAANGDYQVQPFLP